MDDLLAARSQMAMSLAFHIVFAVIGIGMPLLMVIAERRWLKTRDPHALELAKRWAKGTAIMFAVGAVSGTVLSFELSLLWPAFMEFAGPIIGMPFSLEGFAFFLEAIFLGIYLYGWKKVPEKVHFYAGVMVMVCGTLSGIFVVAANAWMNSPTGYEVLADGSVSVDVWAAMFNDAMFAQTFHMTMAAFTSVGFAVAGIHAYALRKHGTDNPFHRQAYRIALTVGGLGALMMLVSGDIAAKVVAETQPLKLAAMEAHWDTEKGAPLYIGGIVDEEAETTSWAIPIPGGLSFLAFGDFDAEVKGVKEWPKDERPPVAIVHYAFQLMIACGFAMNRARAVGGLPRLAPQRAACAALVPAAGVLGDATGVHRDAGGLGRDRSGPAALGHPGRHEDGGRGHPNAPSGGALPRVHGAVPVPVGHRGDADEAAGVRDVHLRLGRAGVAQRHGGQTCSLVRWWPG